jgi:GNAT superfamily N-acetyltransferase
MTITIREVAPNEVEDLIPLLLLAEESEQGLRWGLAHLVDTVYRMDDDSQLVGAATLRWHDEPCEIQELAISEERQGQGLGKQFVAWLIEEARRRGKHRLLVGTANSSIPNIAFYQKCGLRMDHIRHDYFRYYHKPVYEHGIRMRDMLVFSYDLTQESK